MIDKVDEQKDEDGEKRCGSDAGDDEGTLMMRELETGDDEGASIRKELIEMMEESARTSQRVRESLGAFLREQKILEATSRDLVAKAKSLGKRPPSITVPSSKVGVRASVTSRTSESWVVNDSRSGLSDEAKRRLEQVRVNSKSKGASTRRAGELIHQYAKAQGWLKFAHDVQSSRMQQLVANPKFDAVAAGFIIINSAFLGIATDYAARHRVLDSSDMPIVFDIADYICNAWFLLELLIRITAEGPMVFFTCLSPTWSWNMFDTIVVGFSLVEIVFKFAEFEGGANVTPLRILRVMRVARALRIIRLIRLFKDFRMMVLSLFNSFATLVWALVLLMICMFIFSILLCQNVTSHLGALIESGNVDQVELLEDSFGSLTKSTYTLFLSVTNGVSWKVICDRLFELSWSNGIMFCFYIFFTVFAILNIVTGVFLESALSACKNDESECIQTQMQTEESSVRGLQKLFDDVDKDGSGVIEFQSFSNRLGDPRVRAYLSNIGIDVDEAEGLFKLLDLDGSGTITTEEFLYGCMRIKGTAKAIDVQTLLYENKKMFSKWTKLAKNIDKTYHLLQRVDEHLDAIGERARPTTTRWL